MLRLYVTGATSLYQEPEARTDRRRRAGRYTPDGGGLEKPKPRRNIDVSWSLADPFASSACPAYRPGRGRRSGNVHRT